MFKCFHKQETILQHNIDSYAPYTCRMLRKFEMRSTVVCEILSICQPSTQIYRCQHFTTSILGDLYVFIVNPTQSYAYSKSVVLQASLREVPTIAFAFNISWSEYHNIIRSNPCSSHHSTHTTKSVVAAYVTKTRASI